MKSITKCLCMTALAALLASCMLFPRTRLDVFLYDDVDAGNQWQLGSVSVERKTLDAEIERMVPEALRPLSHAHKLPLDLQEGPHMLALDIAIVEREFTRDLESLTSISYTATLRETEGGRRLAQAVYAEESTETLASFYHLYAVTETVLKSLAEKLARQAKAGG